MAIRTRALTIVVAVMAVILGSTLAWTPSALAHAVVEQISPADRARLDSAPAEVRITFSEAVQLLQGRDASVVTETGESVASGPGVVPADNANQVVIPLQRDLGAGSYTARWRIVSADGHIVGGASVFAVGDVPLGQPYLGGPGGAAGPSETSVWAVSARWIELVGIGGLVALLLFRLLVWRSAWRPPPEVGAGARDASLAWARDAWWIGFGALALVALFGEACVLVVKTAGALGVSVWGALGDPAGIVRVLADTRFGSLLQIRTLALFLLFALGVWRFLAEYRTDRAPRPDDADGGTWQGAVMLAAALVALGSISAQGHASVARLPALQVPTDALHATCAAFWVGGLVITTIWLLRLPRVSGPGGRTVGGLVLARFSQLALIAVALIVLTGVVRAFGEMSSPADLWQTSYGWTILVKIGLLGIAGVLALRSRKVVTTLRRTGAPNTATLALVRRNAWVEIGVTLVIIAAASLLVAQVPPLG